MNVYCVGPGADSNGRGPNSSPDSRPIYLYVIHGMGI